MNPIALPTWVESHLYPGKSFTSLTPDEIGKLAEKLASFRSDQPDVSVVIPAWNEGDNIYRTLSSLAATITTLKVEIIVINNNSTDHLSIVLDTLGVLTYNETSQGIAFARQLGLDKARGTYHLCADADTLYPPHWIDAMTRPLREKGSGVTGVYGRYAFLPLPGHSRLPLWGYELLASIAIRHRRKKHEFINVLGFNMGLITEVGRSTGGFRTSQVRVFNNEQNVEESEDGAMALRLKTKGRLHLVTDPHALVYTSPRKVLQDGSLSQAFFNRLRKHLRLGK